MDANAVLALLDAERARAKEVLSAVMADLVAERATVARLQEELKNREGRQTEEVLSRIKSMFPKGEWVLFTDPYGVLVYFGSCRGTVTGYSDCGLVRVRWDNPWPEGVYYEFYLPPQRLSVRDVEVAQ